MNDFARAGRARTDVEVISLMGFAHGTSHFFHLMLPSLFPWLMRDFGLNFTRAGSLTAAFFVASGIGQALAGFVVDRVGALRVLCAGILLFSVAGVVLGSANSYGTLLAAAVLAGTGNSVFHPADFTTLNQRVSTPRLGHAFSVHSLSGNLGWAAGPVFMTGVAAATNWRLAAFAAAAIALVTLTVLVSRRGILAGTATGQHRAHDATAGATVFAFLGVGAVWMCFLFFLVTMLAFGALQNFAPAVLQRVYGVSLAAAASALTLYLLGGAAGVVVGGFLAAKSSAHDRVVAIALVFAALTALAVASGAIPPWSVGAFFTIIGFCTGIASPSRDLLVRKAAMERFGQQSFGRIYGFVYSGLDVGLATAPLVFGRMMDKSMFSAVLGGVALLQGIGVAAALKVGQQHPKERYLLKPLPPKRD
jgi:MFS family permease